MENEYYKRIQMTMNVNGSIDLDCIPVGNKKIERITFGEASTEANYEAAHKFCLRHWVHMNV